MALFRYDAKDRHGAASRGVVDAGNRRDALERLSERGLVPWMLEPVRGHERSPSVAIESDSSAARGTATMPALAGEPGASSSALRSSALDAPVDGATTSRPSAKRDAAPIAATGGRITRKQITAFTRELATLLEATIPVPSALEGLAAEEPNAALRGVIDELAARVRRGESLSDALAAFPRYFPTLYAGMVAAGEEAGALPRVLADLADLLEHEDEMRAEVVAAAAYPCFVLGFGVLTTFILLVFVLPRLFAMLEGMTNTLPLPTRLLLDTSRFCASYGWVIIALGIAGSLALRWWIRTPAGAFAWDSWKLRLPLLGRIFRTATLVRFAHTLGTLTQSGVSLLPALRIVESTVGNRAVGAMIARAAETTRAGDSLAAPLRELGIFPPTMIQMIAVGEDTGRLDVMLLRVARVQERQLHATSRTLISFLGPVLILGVGLLIGFIVIAILLPIFQMSQAVR
jgi:general secretion pathway protein F